jgi:xylulose-5-phosphate/fructose-6-phosphate phosphoketolase
LDRYHLLADVIDRMPKLGYIAAYVKQFVRDKLIEHKQHIEERGEDMPDVRNWRWPIPPQSSASSADDDRAEWPK